MILIAGGFAAVFILILGALWIGPGIQNKIAETKYKVSPRGQDIDVSKLSRADLPQLVSAVIKENLSQEFRMAALGAIMTLRPDDDQIDTLASYVKRTLPKYKYGDDDTCYRIGFAFIGLYTKTKNDRPLQALRLVFKSPECGQACRHDILIMLRETDAKNNIPFFIDILNDSKSIEDEKQVAACGLGVAGSDYGMQRLKTMASYYFDRKIKRGHLIFAMMALHALKVLAENRNEEANRTIQSLAEKCCKNKLQKSPYKDYWGAPFAMLAEIGGDQNRAFLESLRLEKCINSEINQTILDTLENWSNKSNHQQDN
jgi:hypothetical protein